ncbi:REP element-mobilizing transposase RayT [Algoriphagus faecimaris]|uniref:REP element-mobilizing transposase RayT n=1 Tax=Algoriphagus faecimaris TaxID=686796 RepID=A0A1G6UFW1_9BACT|nr:IS200/IS605 family transposase [Algoriphagus faecimaris]SDD40290.1 REP element-mobilizing transposase RayT [Algoriphagus faecimaris]
MPNTYSSLYCQSVFAVKYRSAVIKKSFEKELYAVIGNLINEAGCQTLIVNGVSDHVHCLFRFYPRHSISDVMKSVKSKSSKWLNESGYFNNRFEWQIGFGCFAYSQSQVSRVSRYINNQEEHHKNMTFKAEYIELLKAHNISYLPEYLFEDLQ